jgi:hypothetical protein
LRSFSEIFEMDREKPSERHQQTFRFMLCGFGTVIGLIVLTGCASTAPGPLSIASIGPVVSAGESCPKHAPGNLAHLHPDITSRIETTYANKDVFDLSVVLHTPVSGEQMFAQAITQKQVFLGPAVAAFEPVGGEEQTAYVPAGWIGYVELENHHGLRCHMIPAETTESGRRIVEFLGEQS